MRKSGTSVFIAVAALMACSIAVRAHAADAKTEIEEMEHKFAAATSADEIMKYVDNSDELVVFDLMTPREFDGPKAVREDFQNAFNSFKNPKIEFVKLQVIANGNLGVAESVQHMTATDPSGKPIDTTFRVTDVWRKEKGGWKLIHAHISYPIDMATGKADMQSK